STRSRPFSTSQTATSQTIFHGIRRQMTGIARRPIQSAMAAFYPPGDLRQPRSIGCALANRAPVGGPVGLALAARTDRRAAAWAGTAGAAVDGAVVAAVVGGVSHQLMRRTGDAPQLLL